MEGYENCSNVRTYLSIKDNEKLTRLNITNRHRRTMTTSDLPWRVIISVGVLERGGFGVGSDENNLDLACCDENS